MSKENNRKIGSNPPNTGISKTASYAAAPFALLLLTQQHGFSAPTPYASAITKQLPPPKPESPSRTQMPPPSEIWASALPNDSSSYRPIQVPHYSARIAWYQEGLEKIEAMRNLTSNWDTYGAEPPTEASLAKARTVLETLYQMNFRSSRIAASAEGGVAISFFDKQRYSDIEFLNTDDVLAATSLRDGNPHVWEVPAEDLKFVKTMEAIREFIRAK